MAAQQNTQTPMIRNAVKEWLSNHNPEQFTVPQICQYLSRKFTGLDLTKYVSNELLRLEKVGTLASVPGSKENNLYGMGRPPRLYFKVYCDLVLNVLREVRK